MKYVLALLVVLAVVAVGVLAGAKAMVLAGVAAWVGALLVGLARYAKGW